MENVNNPQAKIPAAGWVSNRVASSLSIWASGGWFDIPNGWVSDAPGIVAIHAGSTKSLDVTLSTNGQVEAETHQGNSARGWCKTTLVGAGTTINFGVGGDRGWFDWCKFRRFA